MLSWAAAGAVPRKKIPAVGAASKQDGSETLPTSAGFPSSSFEFFEFRIQAKVPDACGSGSNPYRYFY